MGADSGNQTILLFLCLSGIAQSLVLEGDFFLLL